MATRGRREERERSAQTNPSPLPEHRVWHILPEAALSYPHNIQSTVHTNHGSSFLTPQRIMPHIYLPPFRLRSTHIRFLCCSLPFCSLTFFKNWCRTSSPICTDSKFPDPTISSKTGLVSSSIIISDSPKEIT